MDAKDLRIDAASSEHNDGSKYAQSGTVLQCHRNKSYHDIGSSSMAKVDVPTSRPCAVIGPDRVVPPPATSDVYLKKSAVEPWPYSDIAYRRPPDYPHRLSSYQNPSRNISPRQTFQENMQRIMVPPTYSSAKVNDDSSFAHIPDRSSVLTKNTKMPPEGKYCDVPFSVNPLNEPKTVRNAEVCVSSVNPTLGRTAPPVWPPGSVNLHSPRTYGASEMYHYPEYPSCAGPRPVAMPRTHRTVQEETNFIYPDPYFQEGNLRYKPYPPPKDRYPQARYDYNSNPFHPTSPFPPHKYELQKPIHPHPYSAYTPLKYLENGIADPIMDGYQRPNQQINYNIAYRNQIMHPTYGPMLGNPQNKMHVYPPDGKMKSIPPNSNKMYLEYENTRNKPFPMPDNFFVNEMARVHPIKSQVLMTNHPSANMYPMPTHPYFKKDNKSYDYMTHFKNMDPSMNINNPLLRHSSRFSPSSVAISPTDSNASNDTTQTHGTLQEDCGYVSQSSTASIRSMDTSISRHPHEFYRRYDFRYTPVIRTSPVSNSEVNGNTNAGSNKKKNNIDVRQFLQMWNEGDEDTDNNNAKEAVVKTPCRDGNMPKQHEVINNNNQEQLYVLDLVNVPNEELSKYEHIQKVSKLPENIKGYNNIDILNQFEEAIESSKINCFKPPTPRDFQISMKGSLGKPLPDHMQRPLSPLDVEAKISQSVIHKEVGCNFEIKPCSPKMLNVEMAAPIQNILGERLIEKVANPHMIRSPLLSGINDNMDAYNVMKRKEHLLNINGTEKNSSCKMVNTQFSSQNPIDCMKTNYSLQDLESNSGVCLASLPRLDNDIELSFPEVNQQFINANKSPMAQTNLKELPALEVNDTEKHIPKDNRILLSESNCSSQFSPPPETEKEIVKLSKYRKIKHIDKREDGSWLNSKTIRKDSVIIKNPDNLKTFEEFSEKPFKYETTEDIQQTPINLTSYCNDINEVDHDFKSEFSKTENFNSSFEDAIDFSLNKPDYNILESKSNLEKSNNECRNVVEKYDDQPKDLIEMDNKIGDSMNSESSTNQIDLKFETNTPIVIEETYEEITCHNQHLKSLPLISPINDSNEAISNSSMCTNTAKDDLSLESALRVGDELDKSCEHVNSTLTNDSTFTLIPSAIVSDVNDNDTSNSNGHANENIQEDLIESEDNISRKNDKLKSDPFGCDTTPAENESPPYTSPHQQLSEEAVLTDDDTKKYAQKSSPAPRSLQENNEEVLNAKDDGVKSDEYSNSTFECMENLIDTKIISKKTIFEELVIKESVPSKGGQLNESLLLESYNDNINQTHRTVNCRKELYSPWIQKLILNNEGMCNYIANNVRERDKCVEKILSDTPARNVNTNLPEDKLDITDLESPNLIYSSEVTDNCHQSLQLGNTNFDNTNVDDAIIVNIMPDQNKHETNATLNVEKTGVKHFETIFPLADEDNEKTELRRKSNSDGKNNIDDEIVIPVCSDDVSSIQSSVGCEDNVNVTNLSCDNSINEAELQSVSEKNINIEKQEVEKTIKDDRINMVIDIESLESLDLPKNNVEHCEVKDCIDNTDSSRYKLMSRRLSLKRSLSDSALGAYDNEPAEDVEGRSIWTQKRLKSNKTNTCDLITENLCSILHNNRRNSVSTYNEENVSICIFIDNNCIITDENDEEQKICYAELPDHCLEDLQNDVNEEIEVENTGDTIFPEEHIQEESHDYVSFSESSVLECDEEKEIGESWVDDVACIETVVSDEIADDIAIGSTPSSPKYTDYSDNDESGVFSVNVTNYTDNIIYDDKMFTHDAELIENLYRTSQINKDYQASKGCNKYYDKESLERILSESNSQQGSPLSLDHTNSMLLSDTLNVIKSPDDKENFDVRSLSSPQNNCNSLNDITSDTETEVAEVNNLKLEKTQDDTVHSCESSIDNVFAYKDIVDPTNCSTSSSPEVSSTTSEERNASILLKITNYKGSRISQINDVAENDTNSKSTKDKVFVNMHPNLPVKRPLLTKAAQKYIPPLQESMRDLKVKLPLPQHSLMKLKQMKISKDEPKHQNNLSISKTVKKPKPKFEDVLKSIDEIQFKMHKEKSKKVKKIVPKVVIKKTQNGSHYTSSTSNKDVYNPDLTGRKWQPWVFLEKNNFIDKMAYKRKTRAIYNHRKDTYVLAEKFRKYKSENSSAKFVITQPKLDESSSGHLKYTIRLKHSY